MSQFKIDGGRLDTDGKGETQPIDKNDTPAGKRTTGAWNSSKR
jgi:outer membrane protein OmpA-like peptidoglycan-associated protein